jgi:hypothetical protein
MSYFDDQEESWFANDCKGSPSDYDAAGGIGEWAKPPRRAIAGGGRDRALLALGKVKEFTAWAVSQGYRVEPTKGTWEILRLRIPGQPPVLFFTRYKTASGGSPQHATCQSAGTKLVQRWIRSRKPVVQL